jgi:hypothetical protein
VPFESALYVVQIRRLLHDRKWSKSLSTGPEILFKFQALKKPL